MDQGADTTQKIVIAVAVILGIIIIFTIGYSLYTKAIRAENELANKTALDSQTTKGSKVTDISLTGEAKNSPSVSYDGLIQKNKNESATTTNLEIVNETVPVEVPKEEEVVPKEIEEEPIIEVDTTPTPAPKKPYVAPQPVDTDRPLTYEEIMRIRQLPVDNSPSGNLQTSLEEESGGSYKARY